MHRLSQQLTDQKVAAVRKAFLCFLDFADLPLAPKKASPKSLASGMDLIGRRSRRSMGSAQRLLQPTLQAFTVATIILEFSIGFSIFCSTSFHHPSQNKYFENRSSLSQNADKQCSPRRPSSARGKPEPFRSRLV